MSTLYNENLRKSDISISTSGNNTIISAPDSTGSPGNYLAIDFICLIPTTAVTVQFKTGSTNYGGAFPLDAKQALVIENAIGNEHGIITCGANEAFVINLDSNVQVGGFIRYREVGN